MPLERKLKVGAHLVFFVKTFFTILDSYSMKQVPHYKLETLQITENTNIAAYLTLHLCVLCHVVLIMSSVRPHESMHCSTLIISLLSYC